MTHLKCVFFLLMRILYQPFSCIQLFVFKQQVLFQADFLTATPDLSKTQGEA